jgi:hypothetical protein
MSEASARLGLPFIQPGQAQKELFHNEALALVDGLLHAAAEGGPAAAPPAAPAAGQCWIVAGSPSGAWSGQAHKLAIWTDGGWRFAAPVLGMIVWNKAAGHWLHWRGNAWSAGELPAAKLVVGGQQVVGNRQPAVPSPSGGTTIDAEARSAVAALIVALRSHGLIE